MGSGLWGKERAQHEGSAMVSEFGVLNGLRKRKVCTLDLLKLEEKKDGRCHICSTNHIRLQQYVKICRPIIKDRPTLPIASLTLIELFHIYNAI